jgi:membrane protease YdiL (CAAX protease family)
MSIKKIGQKILYSQLTKIVIGCVVIMAAYFLVILLNSFLKTYEEIRVARLLIFPIIASICILASYIALNRYYERRKVTELSTHNIGKYLFVGLLLGLLIPSLSVLVTYLKGEFVILSVSNITFIFLRDFTISIGLGIATAVFEEVLFRGVLFRLMEEKLGSYLALIISGIIFGFAHLVNENSSFLLGLSISIMSVFIISAYIYTRSLWFTIAIHFAFNFAEINIFGTEVDTNSTSIMVSQEGSKWFTGGEGLDPSVQVVVLCLIAGIILLVLSHKKGNIIKQQVFKVKTE